MKSEDRVRALTPAPVLDRRAAYLLAAGCLGLPLLSSIVLVALVVAGASAWWLVAALPGAVCTWFVVTQLVLRWKSLRWAKRTGLCGIVVTSNSPHWREHIDREWLPHLGDRLAILNWSERSKWPGRFEEEMFRRYLGQREYCPAIVVLQGLRAPLVYRFYRIFKARKHGHEERFREYEADALRAAGVVLPNPALQPPPPSRRG